MLAAVVLLVATDKAGDGCPPDVNTTDEVRWVHGAYGARTAMSAADALMATLKAPFACN